VEDCDDDDPEEFPGASWFPDGDGDGFGDGDVTATVQCERPEGHVAVVGDCDDADDASFPGAPEAVADGVDQDCSETEVCWQDADGDGFGALTVDSLDMDCDDAGESWVDGDCEDADASVHPDVPWYVDGDGDGFGSMIDPSMPSCLPVEGYVSTSTDCDDTAAEIHPGASEFVGDGQDQNCDGIELCYEDLDEDGYGAAVIASDDLDCTDPGESSVGTDCDDADPTRSPETPWYPDTDLDGYGSMEATPIASCEAPGGHLLAADDCDDTSAFVHPGATEVVADGIDQDCDEGDLCYEDQDGDGFGTGLWMSEDLDCADLHEASASGDCDDTDPLVNPSTPWYADGDGDGFGDMMAEPVLSCEMPTGHVIASTDCDDTSVAIYPGALEQVADGVDQDCDSVDLCYVDADGDGYGRSETVPGVDLTCEGLSESFNAEDCDDDDGLEFPGAQWYVDEITVSCEQPAGTVAVAGDCDDTRASVNPLGEEIPGNGLDDDCVDGDLPGPTTGTTTGTTPGTTTGTTPGTTTGRTPGTITVPVEPVPEEDPEVVSYQSGGCGGCASTSTNGMWVALLAMAFIRRRREHIEGSFF
jgi:MYXO-CTERM domain-containing protein